MVETRRREAAGRRRRTAGALAVVATMLALAAGPAHAAGSRFVYEICDAGLPGGGITAAPVILDTSPEVTPFQTCSSPGGSIGLRQSERAGGRLAGGVRIEVSVPQTPGGFVESETMSASASTGLPGESGFVFGPGWPPDGVEDVVRTFQISGPPGTTEWGGDFPVGLECIEPFRCLPGPWVGVRDIAATEVDPNPPTIVTGGSLLAAGVQRGRGEVTAQAADVGGGMSRVEVLVDGAPAGAPDLPACALAKVANPGYTGTVVTSPSPCPASVTAVWELDTAAYPFEEGANSVQVCASDLATLGEPNRTCSPAQVVTVDDSCTESSVGGGTDLSAQFARNKKAQVTVPYGTGARVTGELEDAAGEAISGATICVQSATQGSGGGLVPSGTATTDSAGRFSYAIPGGPDREVLLGYRHGSFEIAHSIRYFAHVRPTLRLSAAKVHNGAGIRLSGKLPGGVRAAGRVVVLKAAALHSGKWYPFGETTTDGDGHFHYHYRFDGTTRTTIYRMEAVVPTQDHYPFKGGHSKPALVEVRG